MKKRDIPFATPVTPRGQQVLFPRCLDEVVGEDEPVRALAALLEQVDWSEWEAAYAGCGQPPIHPRFLAGAILWGLLNRIRSSRMLERASRKDLDFIWLLEGFTPDHSTFAGFRKRHLTAIKDLQNQFARKLVERREKALLHLILDGTRLRADSDRQGARTARWIEAVVEELNGRLAALEAGDEQIEALRLEEVEGPPPDDGVAKDTPEVARLKKKLAQCEHALAVARQRDEKARRHNGKDAKPARVPFSDPESQVLPNKEGGYAPNYTPVAAVEAQTGAITYSNVLEGAQEAGAVMPAVEATKEVTGQVAGAVLADGNFAAGPVLAELAEQGTDAYMPTRSASPPDNPAHRPDPTVPVAEEDHARLPQTDKGKLTRAAFMYDGDADVYHCPMGQALQRHKRGKDKDGTPYTEYRCTDCSGCPLFGRCVLGKTQQYRTIRRDIHEPLREAADQRMATPDGQALYKQRAPGIEGVFGHIKAIFGIRRFTVRGLQAVRAEWNWVCTAYNLKKLLITQAQSVLGGPRNGIYPAKTG